MTSAEYYEVHMDNKAGFEKTLASLPSVFFLGAFGKDIFRVCKAASFYNECSAYQDGEYLPFHSRFVEIVIERFNPEIGDNGEWRQFCRESYPELMRNISITVWGEDTGYCGTPDCEPGDMFYTLTDTCVGCGAQGRV